MSRETRLGTPVLVGAALALLLIGVGIGLAMRGSRGAGSGGAAAPTSTAMARPPAPTGSANPGPGGGADAVVTITPEMAKRAGIEIATVGDAAASGQLRIPGVVQPNAYRELAVTSLVDGRITRVVGELGQRVAAGAILAEMFSPQLSELQTSLLGMRADLDAAHERLARTERLVEIGAASRQELEQVRAEHARHAAAVEGARARLMLLGMSSDRVDKFTANETSATLSVLAPIAGVITKRDANAGLNIQTGASLFTIVDLSTVWIVGDVYESSFAAVPVGSPVTVTADAYPGSAFEGRVSYIDPQVQEATRTGKVRIEVANRGEQLRLGMFVNVVVSGPADSSRLAIPRSAVQTVGDRQVVYVADPAADGRFIEREVKLGAEAGDQVTVVGGVRSGDRIVTGGAFFVRAERERAHP
jgi:RND family efflux transporter MFP subunit